MFDPQTQKNIDSWLNGSCHERIKQEIRNQIQKDPQKVKNAFFKKLAFGTGGARALIGNGSNRMNNYTVRALTFALAEHLKSYFPNLRPSVFIGFDSRNNSKEFAGEAARTLAAAGIKSCLFKEPRPTPLVSFGCRYKKCQAAVMITASHNPPRYNGYKVYWEGGAQILEPHDKSILKHFNAIEDPAAVKTAENSSLIETVLEEIDEAYLKELASARLLAETAENEGSRLNILYSNLHGTGITMIPQAMEKFGFSNFSVVKKQAEMDGNFPNAPLPNPEEKITLELGLRELENKKMDLFLASDPDADRIAAAVLHENRPFVFSGNQIAVLLADYILSSLAEKKQLEEDSFCVKSIVTTELFSLICSAFKVECLNVLTGFKYIAQKIALFEGKKTFLLGAEESLGYLYKDFVRDKDAVSTAYLIAEMALAAKLQGKTLFDRLLEIYQKYGIFSEKLISLKFAEGQEGLEQMQRTMQQLRCCPPAKISHIPIVQIEDYLSSQKDNLKLGSSTFLTLPKSNVLTYWLEDKSKIIIRPSGTEPKIKIYLGVKSDGSHADIKQKIRQAEEKLQLLEKNITQELLKP